MKFMHFSLLACLLTFSLNAADEPSYIFEAKGEFAKELKSLVEKYSKDEKLKTKDEMQKAKKRRSYTFSFVFGLLDF